MHQRLPGLTQFGSAGGDVASRPRSTGYRPLGPPGLVRENGRFYLLRSDPHGIADERPVTHRGIIGAGLILFALWLQALAPVAALRALGVGADPLAGAVICGKVRTGDQTNPAEPSQHAGCSLCALCTAGFAAVLLPPSPTVSIALPAGTWHIVSWPIPPPALLRTADHPPGQPRAPPTHA